MATPERHSSRNRLCLFAMADPVSKLGRLFPPATRAELWLGLALLVLSLLGAAWLTKCRSDALALEEDSVIVEGQVVRLWVTTGKGAGYHVTYEYPAPLEGQARIIQGETTLPKKYFDRLKEGGPIAVKVCRTAAANHQVVGESPRKLASTGPFAFSVGLLVLLALAGVLNLLWWWICRRKPGTAQVFVFNVKGIS